MTETKPYDSRSFDHLVEEFDFAATLSTKPAFFIKNLPDRRDAALDVGCGGGNLALELAPLFNRVVAIDISMPMLELARRKRPAPNIEYRFGDANALDVVGPFDAVISRTTLHHVDDLPSTIRQLRSLVRSGGRLIVVDIVHSFLPNRLMGVYAAIRDFPVNILRFGFASARRALRFRLSRPWLEHVGTDHYLTPKEFRRIYGSVLPGARFERAGRFFSVVWQAPETL